DLDCIMKEQIATALAAGCVLVGSSGNGGGLVEMPASLPGVISVGATNRFGAVWSLSAHDAGLDVVAAGVFNYTTVPGNGYTQVLADSGTSYAAAFVSGVCALVLEKFPDTMPWEMQRFLRTQARDVDGIPHGVTGNLDGFGLLSFGTLKDYSNTLQPVAW